MSIELDQNRRKKAGEAIKLGTVSKSESLILQWQWEMFGGFKSKLWAAMMTADENNLAKLSLGFPDEVAALTMFRETWVGESLRSRGLL